MFFDNEKYYTAASKICALISIGMPHFFYDLLSRFRSIILAGTNPTLCAQVAIASVMAAVFTRYT
jgi:hypothetical protein